MLWELVNDFLGGLPEWCDFLKIFGVIFILYCFVVIFKSFVNTTMSYFKRL